MPGKVFLHLIILCGIWSQEFTGTFADEEIKSSDFLTRQKRVISFLPGEDQPVMITEAPYVVYIKEYSRVRCVGSILSWYVVITSAPCVSLEPEHYSVVFSSSRLSENLRFKNVKEIRRRVSNSEHLNHDGIGLLIVDPPFIYTVHCDYIKLHTGPLLPGTIGRIHGWGYNFRNENRGTDIPVKLRSIDVPIISHQNCTNRYRPHLQISAQQFCTYHPQRHSGHLDSGAGLVVNGELAGIFLWSGLIPHSGQTDTQYPDVFASLQDPYYSQWIILNLQSIDSHFRNLHHY